MARGAPKAGGVAVARTAQQSAALEKAAEKQAAQLAALAAEAKAAQLAQMVNLIIGGYSFAQVAAALNMTVDEVTDAINSDTARYVKSQPALRVWTRNWISERYTKLLDTVWDRATDPLSPDNFDAQDRALRLLKEMSRLHGAEAPTQSEVKVDTAPENVEAMVAILAAGKGLDYDASVFDVVPGTVVHDAVGEAEQAEFVSGNALGEDDA